MNKVHYAHHTLEEHTNTRFAIAIAKLHDIIMDRTPHVLRSLIPTLPSNTIIEGKVRINLVVDAVSL